MVPSASTEEHVSAELKVGKRRAENIGRKRESMVNDEAREDRISPRQIVFGGEVEGAA